MKRVATDELPEQQRKKFKRHPLNKKSDSWLDSFALPAELEVKENSPAFDLLWQLHPQEKGQVKLFGQLHETPRWQQSYGQAYRFSGVEHPALSIPPQVQRYLDYANALPEYGGGFNMALLNWYQDGRHHIGYHADDEAQMRASPQGETLVFSLSFGETRTFSLKPKSSAEDGNVPLKVEMKNNSALVMGGRCQKTHKHAVPKVGGRKGERMGRRINMTFRQFVEPKPLKK
jgi:alkylated DNA repair dioxygenase AlkB